MTRIASSQRRVVKPGRRHNKLVQMVIRWRGKIRNPTVVRIIPLTFSVVKVLIFGQSTRNRLTVVMIRLKFLLVVRSGGRRPFVFRLITLVPLLLTNLWLALIFRFVVVLGKPLSVLISKGRLRRR